MMTQTRSCGYSVAANSKQLVPGVERIARRLAEKNPKPDFVFKGPVDFYGTRSFLSARFDSECTRNVCTAGGQTSKWRWCAAEEL